MNSYSFHKSFFFFLITNELNIVMLFTLIMILMTFLELKAISLI